MHEEAAFDVIHIPGKTRMGPAPAADYRVATGITAKKVGLPTAGGARGLAALTTVNCLVAE